MAIKGESNNHNYSFIGLFCDASTASLLGQEGKQPNTNTKRNTHNDSSIKLL
jgi:hypothetical protein